MLTLFSLSTHSNKTGVCEGLLYASKAGLDLTDTIAAVGAGAAGSFSINNLGKQWKRRNGGAAAAVSPHTLPHQNQPPSSPT